MSMLLCFEASARFGSFARAAEELGLSQSAISRSVNNLEALLGIALFRRHRQRVFLTDIGERYAQTVSPLLEQLENETAKTMVREQTDPVLHLATYPTFGSRWLMPRLHDFSTRHPGAELSFVTGVTPFSVHSGEVDVAIQHGRGDWPQSHTFEICDEHLLVVAAPGLSRNCQDDVHAIRRQTLLSLKTRPYDWNIWFDHHELQPLDGHIGPVFETFGLMISAARAGLGVAVVPSIYIQDDINAGRLCSVCEPPVPSGSGFYAVCDIARRKEKKIADFFEWLREMRDAPE